MEIFRPIQIKYWKDYLLSLNNELYKTLEPIKSSYPLREFTLRLVEEFEDIVISKNVRKVDLFFREIDYLFQGYLFSLRYHVKKANNSKDYNEIKSLCYKRTRKIQELKGLYLKLRIFIVHSMEHVINE